MSARVQCQLALALRSAKATRTALYAAWTAENFPLFSDQIRAEHEKSCALADALRRLLRAQRAKPSRHDGRKAASGE